MTAALAIVTGANGHLGNAIARRLHFDGYRILLVVHRNRDAADAVVTELDPSGTTARVLACNLASEDDITELFSIAVRSDERLAVLVNNHGTINRQPIAEVDRGEFERVLATNLTSCWRAIQLVTPLMTASGGAVVNIGSAAARLPMLNLGAYTISKAALHMLTRVAAQELGAQNIRVNTVSPGLVPSAMSQAAFADPEVTRRRKSVLAVGRFGEAEDIAEAVSFLSSSRSGFITGQDLVVDGGSHDNFLKPISVP